MRYNTITIIIICLVLLCGCKTIQYVPVKGDTQIEYRDTTVYRDSVIYIPKETIKEIVPALDTLYMETSLAQSRTYLDTSMRVLRGDMKNKKGITEKITYKDRIVYRDSIVTQEIPVEVIKEIVKTKHPFYEPILWLFALLSIGYISFKLIKRYVVKV